MFEKEFDIANLISLFQKGEVNADQQAYLDQWLAKDLAHKKLWEQLNSAEGLQEKLSHFGNINEQLAWSKISREINFTVTPKSNLRVFSWKTVSIAASILIILSIAIYNVIPHGQKVVEVSTYANDIAPGKQGATLTLANGKQIVLDGNTRGKIAQQAGVTVEKADNGAIAYHIDNSTSKSESTLATNTLKTDKGQTFQLLLPDGSKVWLNAASSLSYNPELVNNGVRSVQLSGEAYFEISKNKTLPFVVISAGQQVRVLGTHFNISSYSNEQATTTLLEGSVKVVIGTNELAGRTLVPGQQAILNNETLTLKKANLQQAISWKDGYFRFDDEPLESVMRKLSRWYNIEVYYQGNPKGERFTGKISMQNNISQILNAMETTKAIHFKVEGRRVTVIQ